MPMLSDRLLHIDLTLIQRAFALPVIGLRSTKASVLRDARPSHSAIRQAARTVVSRQSAGRAIGAHCAQDK
jgi:hypothetical protein